MLFGTIFAIVCAAAAHADDSCGDCVERKQRMCSTECALAKPEQARSCQQKCISGYCAHRCAANAPELAAWVTPDCDTCLEQQYAQCEEECTVGTGRHRAICQLDCADSHCTAECGQAKVRKGK